MYRKNVASQTIYVAMVNATTGAAITSATVTAVRSIDGASQGAATGSMVEDGNGQYHLSASQADMNGNNIGFLFTATGAVPVSICVVTTAADPTDAVRFGLTALPNANAAANGGLPTVDASNAVKVQSGTGANQISLSSGAVIVQSGTGTGQLDIASGQVKVQSGTGAGQISTTSGRVQADTVYWNGTAVATPDTAGYPKVTVKSGTGTGEISLASGVAAASLSSAERNATADALLVRDLTAVSGPPPAYSLWNAIRRLRDRVASVAGVLSVYDETGTGSPAYQMSITSDSAAEPITEVTPL